MNRWLKWLILPILLLILPMRLWGAWEENQAAVNAVAHISTTLSCAVDEVHLQWNGTQPEFTNSVYLQAVISSAQGTDWIPPTLASWRRDARLYYWFRAQDAVKNNAYKESLFYLTQAEAGSLLDAAGHFALTPACSIINWTVASELGYRDPPDGNVQGLINNKQWEEVAQAFNRLLRYDPQRVAWRLKLAQAYVALGKTAAAQDVLVPVLQHGTVDEIQAAKRLLVSDQLDQ